LVSVLSTLNQDFTIRDLLPDGDSDRVAVAEVGGIVSVHTVHQEWEVLSPLSQQ